MIKGGSIEDASQYYCDKVSTWPEWLGDPPWWAGRLVVTKKYFVTNHRRGMGGKRLSRVFQNDEGDGYLVLIRITPDEEGRFGFNLKVCCECAFRLCAVEQPSGGF